jgi:hypothetical protein
MPLSYLLTITQDDGGETATIDNDTTYGGANQDRNEAAEYLLWSKTDKNGTRVFDDPDQGNVLTNLQYIVNTPIDGHYEAIVLRIQPYNAGSNYVEEQTSGAAITQYASVFYYATTGKVYKAIAASTGQDPEDTDYFEEVTAENLYTLIGNSNLETFYEDFKGEYLTNAALRDRFANVACCTAEDRDYNQTLLYLKQSADINFANENYSEYENIIRNFLAPKLAQA